MALVPPTFGPDRAYADTLGDAGFWAPYVNAAVRGGVEAPPEVGTFPTFRVGDVYVKLFCEMFGGGDCHRIERALADLFEFIDVIPSARVLDSGVLFAGADWPWPYLVFSALPGTAAMSTRVTTRTAAQVGEAVAALHGLNPPEAALHVVPAPGPKPSLPAAFQPAVLPAIPVDDAVIVHADLHDAHILLDDDGHLTGILDWGDAFLANRYYELGALQLGLFHGDTALLGAFLRAYGWPNDGDFVAQAWSATLSHQFDVFNEIEVPAAASADELAERLFGVGR